MITTGFVPFETTVLADLLGKAEQDGIEKFCTGAAIVRDGKLLIVKRSDDDEVFAAHYEIPGGTVDPGEDILTGLKREIMEETGLTISHISHFLGTMDWVSEKSGQKVRQFNFLVTADGDVTLSHEHSALLWVDPSDAETPRSLPISDLMKLTVIHALKCVARIA